MGFFDRIKSELIDIIEWLDNTQDTMVFRFERHDNEIKNGAKLIVRESQAAVFINEGKVADVFGPGTYTLATQNLPILSTLKGWKYGFDSPFKAEVYFISTKQFLDQKWGTPNPIMMRDPDFGIVRIRAFGNFSIKVSDPVKFLQEVVGTNKTFTTDEISSQLKSLVITRFTDAVGESKIPVLDLAASYNELSKFCESKLKEEFPTSYGIDILKFLINNISLPPEVEKAIDKRSSMGALGDLNKYAQMQQADAMRDAANNQGGGGGMEGMMGMAMAQQMMNMQQQQMQNQNMNQMNNQQFNNSAPPPPPMGPQYHVSINGQQQGPFDVATLKNLIAQNQLTKQTYVWKAGMSGWLQAEQVPEVMALFSMMPPPPPPPPSF
jgi:membrane protease subunit (stomatin/prohibitin family)